MSKINSIFVYGTLQIGKQHENILKDLDGNWQKGYVYGKLTNTSNNSDYGYPCLELDKKGEKIHGMIFSSKKFRKKIREIDEFEGKNYQRVVAEIHSNNGSKIQAYLYEKKK